MNFAYRLKVQSCQLRSCIVLTVVTEFFVAEFAYNRPCSNNNLPYGYVCVLQHPKAADILLLLCSVFFLHLVILVLRIFHKRDPNKVAVFLAAQKLLPMINYIQTTHYHINQEPMRQCIYTVISQDSFNAPNRTYLTCTIYFKGSFIIMYSLLHRNQRKRKKGEYFTA